MTFQVSTAASMADISSQIAAFAVANAGFVDNGDITVNGQQIKRLSKGGIYYYFGPFAISRGYSVYNLVYKLGLALLPVFPFMDASVNPNGICQGQMEFGYMSGFAFAGPYPNLYLFTEGTCVHACVELTNGIFNHFSFGKITKTDTFTGGEYMTAGNYNGANSTPLQWYPPNSSQNVTPFNSFSGGAGQGGSGYVLRRPPAGAFNDQRDFAPFGGVQGYYDGTLQGARGSIAEGINDRLLRDSPNQGTLRSVMLNNYIFLYDPVSKLYRSAGYIPNMRAINMQSLDLAEVIYTDWQVFPVTQRNGSSSNAPNSVEMGIAYQR